MAMPSTNYGFASGTYAFSPQWTQYNALTADTTSGNDIASLLVGIPTSGSVAHNANPYFMSRVFALYFQDDWKVNKRLSLNLGIRWDYNSPRVRAAQPDSGWLCLQHRQSACRRSSCGTGRGELSCLRQPDGRPDLWKRQQPPHVAPGL